MITKFAQTNFKWIHVFYSIAWYSYLEEFIKDTPYIQEQTLGTFAFPFSLAVENNNNVNNTCNRLQPFFPAKKKIKHTPHTQDSLSLSVAFHKLLQPSSSKLKSQEEAKQFQVNLTPSSLFLYYSLNYIINDFYVYKTLAW